jgi:hypothetical protein
MPAQAPLPWRNPRYSGKLFCPHEHECLAFPETAYRLECFTINAKNKALAPVLSQPPVAAETLCSPVSKPETDSLLADIGFAPV